METQWLSQAVITAITGLIVGVPSFFFGRRKRVADVHKTEAETSKIDADAVSVLSTVVANLGLQLANAHAEIPKWKEQFTELEKQMKTLGEQANEWERKALASDAELERIGTLLTICENREPLGIDTANMMRAEVASIVENIRHVDFKATTDPVSKEDAPYLRRFKEIHESAKRIGAVI